MTLEQIMDEALCYQEAFRRLGFTADEVFIGIDGPNTGTVKAIIRADDKDFAATCGYWEGDEKIFAEKWKAKIEWWNSPETPDAARTALWEKSAVAANATNLVVYLLAQGFELRNTHSDGDKQVH